MLKWRRLKNTVRGIDIQDPWCAESSRVKDEIRNYFMLRFSAK